MYKIGDFSKMSNLTIKTLRYYEKKGILKPVFIDKNNGYRYYDSKQLSEVSKIISLKQIGLSLKDIKNILNGQDKVKILEKRKKEIEEVLINYNTQLSEINSILGHINVKKTK